jgi:hypothetical protein
MTPENLQQLDHIRDFEEMEDAHMCQFGLA